MVGVWQATVHGISESDMTEQLTLVWLSSMVMGITKNKR